MDKILIEYNIDKIGGLFEHFPWTETTEMNAIKESF